MRQRPYLGINVSLQHCLERPPEQYVACMQAMGVSWVRLELDWYAPIDKSRLVAFVRALRAADIKILGLLTGLVPGTVRNFFRNERFPRPMAALDAFLSFVQATVHMLKKDIKHWEIYNEQNTYRFWRSQPDPQAYVFLYEKTVGIIRKEDKNAKIVLGSILGDDRSFFLGAQKGFFKRLQKGGLAKEADFFAIHPYTWESYLPGRSHKAVIKAVKKHIASFMHRHPQKPLMVTEYGINTLTAGCSGRRIGEMYHALHIFCAQHNVILFLWVLNDFQDKNYAWYNPEKYFGLYDTRLRPKPAARILKQC